METSAARKILEEVRSNPPLGIQKYDDNYLGRPQFYFEKLIQESNGIFWEILELEKTALCSCQRSKPVSGINLIRAAINKRFDSPFNINEVNYLQWVILYISA